jgi:hypothetical protein
MYVSVPSAIIDDLQLSSGSGLVYPKAPAKTSQVGTFSFNLSNAVDGRAVTSYVSAFGPFSFSGINMISPHGLHCFMTVPIS